MPNVPEVRFNWQIVSTGNARPNLARPLVFQKTISVEKFYKFEKIGKFAQAFGFSQNYICRVENLVSDGTAVKQFEIWFSQNKDLPNSLMWLREEKVLLLYKRCSTQ